MPRFHDSSAPPSQEAGECFANHSIVPLDVIIHFAGQAILPADPLSRGSSRLERRQSVLVPLSYVIPSEIQIRNPERPLESTKKYPYVSIIYKLRLSFRVLGHKLTKATFH